MGGRVYLDNAFEDVQFPADKCVTVVDVAGKHIGTHHTPKHKLRAIWRAYTRRAEREGWQWNGTAAIAEIMPAAAADSSQASQATAAIAISSQAAEQASSQASSQASGHDPSRPQICAMSSGGDPYEVAPASDRALLGSSSGARASARSLPRPVPTAQCISAHDDAVQRRAYPNCLKHMEWVRKHAMLTGCWGVAGRRRCSGFQLDQDDACNLQYYIFCQGVYKFSADASERYRTPHCPPPAGYPEHCCYGTALEAKAAPAGNASSTRLGSPRAWRRAMRPARYLLDVFPPQAQRRRAVTASDGPSRDHAEFQAADEAEGAAAAAGAATDDEVEEKDPFAGD